MAKFCSNCGKELDNTSAMCLNCGVVVENANNTDNTKKKKGLPTWAIVFIVIGCLMLIPIILIILFGIFTYNVIKDIDFNEIIDETLTQTGTIGDTLITDEFSITLTDALIYDSVGDDEKHKEIPVEGREFLILFFDIENVSDESEYITHYDFSGYVDNYSIPVKYLFSDINGYGVLGTNLLPGKKTRGYVAFEVESSWKEFDIYYEGLFEEHNIVFKVVNNDNFNVIDA